MTIPNRISAISLFVEDLAAAKVFYADMFGAKPVFEDDVSAALSFGETIINLLQVGNAAEIIEPATVGARGGSRFQLSVWVDDVDTIAAELKRRGVMFNGPVDRHWGMRTINFADPSGHDWEVAQRIGR